LFLAETLDRELQAVDSENKKNLQNDTWRLHQLSKSLSNPKHPYCHFSTGNLETLKELPAKRGVNVRDEFMKFHERYYSANTMKLVVLGRESLDHLQEWVVKYFSDVKNKDLPDPSWGASPLLEEHISVGLSMLLYVCCIDKFRPQFSQSPSWTRGILTWCFHSWMRRISSSHILHAILVISLDTRGPDLY
jgi:hypothetical protein